MSNEASRMAFEAWATREGIDISLWERFRDIYSNRLTNYAWIGWQASRKALANEQAQIDDLRTQLARRTVERDMAIQMAACGEQAQTVEPVAWISKHGLVYPLDAKDEVHPINELQPLYCHSASPPTEPTIKQPLSTERAGLIERIMDEIAYFAHNDTLEKLLNESAQMLEADAQQVAVPAGWYHSDAKLAAILGEIDLIQRTELKSQTDHQKERVRDLRAECVALHYQRISMLKAPQPPKGDTPTHEQAFQFLHDRDNSAKCFLSAIANLTAERDLLLNKKSQQAAVPMNMAEIVEAAGAQHIDVYVASFMCGIRSAEAHHGITPQGDEK